MKTSDLETPALLIDADALESQPLDDGPSPAGVSYASSCQGPTSAHLWHGARRSPATTPSRARRLGRSRAWRRPGSAMTCSSPTRSWTRHGSAGSTHESPWRSTRARRSKLPEPAAWRRSSSTSMWAFAGAAARPRRRESSVSWPGPEALRCAASWATRDMRP